jgi:hypothetical protein
MNSEAEQSIPSRGSHGEETPFAYAYVYESHFTGMEVVHFGTNGAKVNGRPPVCAIALFQQKRPTITAEEREVLATVRDIYESQGDDFCDRIAEVIGRLLERTK